MTEIEKTTTGRGKRLGFEIGYPRDRRGKQRVGPGPGMSMVSAIRKGNLASHMITPEVPKNQQSCDSLWIYILTSYWDFHLL